MPLAVMLHEELLVEQPPEQRHRLAGELGLDLVGSALNRDGRVARNGAPLGLRSEEHTSELQSIMRISSAAFCLKKKTASNTRYKSRTSINKVSIPQHNQQHL